MPIDNTSSAHVLEVSELRCGYGLNEVVRGISLTVDKGEIVCLIGPNGAGKSTLIKALFGVIQTSAGRVSFAGEDITRADTASRVARGMALVPEGRGVMPTLTVEDNLLMGGYVQRRAAWFAAQLDHMFQLFPILAERRQQAAGTLSGGEQQMLVIARALMSRPTLLVLDEPSFGLAPKIIATIFETIANLRKSGLTILLVEQNANIALQVSQRGYVLDSGRCVLTDTASRLRSTDLVKEIYLGGADASPERVA
jgi:branched-chain amino acid transport system ATP-binding protein